MYFNSIHFVLFYAVVWTTVLLLARMGTGRSESTRGRILQARNALLLLASYVFYAAWDWRFLGLIVVSTLVDYGCGLAMGSGSQSAGKFPRKGYLILSLVTNLGILAFFKYAGFFLDSAVEFLAFLGLEAHLPSLRIVLPVGISFYTFQTLSYTIDRYRERLPVERDLLAFATYVAFFPQLVAGPIERARDLLPQFRRLATPRWSELETGAMLMAWGLFKKVVIADNVAKLANLVFDLDAPSGLQVLLGTYAFAVQIYCDFSGYTDIARGAARCMGFELSLNFNLPYFAQSPSDFWKRWHISLSSWLRDYLYIPLGGNRKGSRRTAINLMLTMLLGGLWHGAAWHFVAWGAFHGSLLMVYRWVQPWFFHRVPEQLQSKVLPRLINGVLFFQLVCVSWLLFRASSIRGAFVMLLNLFGASGQAWTHLGDASRLLPLAACVSVLLLVVQGIQYLWDDHLFVLKLPVPLRSLVYALGALIFLYVGEFGGDAFIYFQF